MWSKKYYGNENALPSMGQVLTGLNSYYSKHIKETCTDVEDDIISEYLKGIDEIFKFLETCVDNLNLKLKYTSLYEPYSKELCLLLYLYSMEPPFYAAIHTASI